MFRSSLCFSLFLVLSGCAPRVPAVNEFPTVWLEKEPALFFTNAKDPLAESRDWFIVPHIVAESFRPQAGVWVERTGKGNQVWIPEGLAPGNPLRQINLQTPYSLITAWVDSWKNLKNSVPHAVVASGMEASLGAEMAFRLESEEVWLINPSYTDVVTDWTLVLGGDSLSSGKRFLKNLGIENVGGLVKTMDQIRQNPVPGQNFGYYSHLYWDEISKRSPLTFLEKYRGKIHLVFTPGDQPLSASSRTLWKQWCRNRPQVRILDLSKEDWEKLLKEELSN